MDNWEKIDGVQRMQDYIDGHIQQPITIKMLADAAGYSPWYAARIFRELTGKAPFEYIRSLRLSQAAKELWDGEKHVMDVALDFVFDSHEGFTRAFSRQFGLTPSAYREKSPPLPLFMPSGVRSYYRLIRNRGGRGMEKEKDEGKKVRTIFVQVMEQPERRMIVRRGIKAEDYYDYCEEVGCEVWGVLSSIREALQEPAGLWLPESMRRTGTSVYVQGVEVPADYMGELPDGFEFMKVPACKMMVFQGQPYDDEVFDSAIREVWAAIEEYNPEVCGFSWAPEDGPRFQLQPMGYRGYIEGRPVRLLKK